MGDCRETRACRTRTETAHGWRAVADVRFHEDWLHLYQLDSATRDADAFPEFSEELVEAMRAELQQVGHDPDAVFYYSFVQAKARVG